MPLIVRCPGTAPAGLSVRSLVQLTDVLPTVLELVGRGADDLMLQGRSLLPIEPDRTYRQYVIAESQGPYVQKLKKSEQQLERIERGHRMLRQGDYKYMYGADGSDDSDDGELLFDLASDPDELHNLVAEQPARAPWPPDWRNGWARSSTGPGSPSPRKSKSTSLKTSGRGAIGFRRRVRPHPKSAHGAAARVRKSRQGSAQQYPASSHTAAIPAISRVTLPAAES